MGGLVIPVKDKTRILSSSDSLPRQAEVIVKTVTSLSELQQNKDAYLENLALPGAAGAMSDADRNQIDAGADNIAKQCRSLILKYQDDVSNMSLVDSAQEHHDGVVSGLQSYLQSVVSVHSQMRAIRVSRHVEMRRLSKLEVTSVQSRAMEIGSGHTIVSEQELREKAVSAAASSSKPSTFWDETVDD